MRATHDIALFPLGTVLFPGGLLPLRIFEPRYVDMISRCMREDELFGVVQIYQGTETSSTVHTAPIGTCARIVDFETLADGLLGLLCRGERRFRILSATREDDGLNRAAVEWLPEAPATPLDAAFTALLPVLRRVIAELDSVARFVEPRYDDANWVSFRLAEYLPLDLSAQQRLLEMDDANARLRLLAPLIDTSRGTRSK